jgi:Amt family ammonium transporter
LLVVVPYSFLVSFGIFKLINYVIPIRVSSQDEEEGLDATQHAEKYLQGTLLVATPEGLKEHESHH